MEEISKKVQIVKTLKDVVHSLKKTLKDEYKDVNLTRPQGMLMGTLIHSGKMKISDLSEKMNLSNSTVSGILDRLEKQGFVERTRSEEDRRVVYINVTSEFKKIYEDKFKEVEKNIEFKMSEATEEEIDKIAEGLNILKRLLD